MNLVSFPHQNTIEFVQYSWIDFTSLGKVNVMEMLNDKGINYTPGTSYFKLCSLLYRDYKASVIDFKTGTEAVKVKKEEEIKFRKETAEWRAAKARKKLENSRSTVEYLDALQEEFEAEVDKLLF